MRNPKVGSVVSLGVDRAIEADPVLLNGELVRQVVKAYRQVAVTITASRERRIDPPRERQSVRVQERAFPSSLERLHEKPPIRGSRARWRLASGDATGAGAGANEATISTGSPPGAPPVGIGWLSSGAANPRAAPRTAQYSIQRRPRLESTANDGDARRLPRRRVPTSGRVIS